MAEFDFLYLRNENIAPFGGKLDFDSLPERLSDQVAIITGQPAMLCPKIAGVLGEPRYEGYTPRPGSHLAHNLQVVAKAIAGNRVSFPRLDTAEAERPGARATIGYAAEEFWRMLESGHPLILLPPKSVFGCNGKSVLPTKVRAVINTEKYFEERRNSAVYVLIREWQQAIKGMPVQDQLSRLAEISPYGRAWRGLAVVLGEASGFDYSQQHVLVNGDPEVKKLLDSLYPLEQRRMSRQSADELARKYCKILPKSLLSKHIQYKVPVTYCMDFDSVARRIFHARNCVGSDNPLSFAQKDEILENLGLYFYFDVLDVFQVSFGTLPSRWKDLFNDRKLTYEIVGRITDFINECECVSAHFAQPAVPDRVLTPVDV